MKNAQAMPGRFSRFSVLGTILLEAIPAVHGPIAAGLEGHLGSSAAAVADDFVHLTFAAIAAILPTGSTASGAPTGFILETLFGVESLFGSGEHEFVATFTAGERLVLIH